MKNWPLGLWRSLSGTGLLLGTLFFAASLTPTLIPRTYLTQGVLGGGVFAIGYGLGVFWRWLWSYCADTYKGFTKSGGCACRGLA